MFRGILDTSTLILLGRLQETDPLPAEPLITAITLSELSVGPLVVSTDGERAAPYKRTSSRPKPILCRCRLTLTRPAASGELPQGSQARAANQPHAPMTP